MFLEFHSHLYGHHFKLQDHKPLVYRLVSKALSPQASARLQQWTLLVASYDYTIGERPRTVCANTDAVSRVPPKDMTPEPEVPPELFLMIVVDSPESVTQIAKWTQ